MSKAFLFIALALVIACASAANWTFDYSTATGTLDVTKCTPALGFVSNGKFWIIGDYAAAADWTGAGKPGENCFAELKTRATTVTAITEYKETDAAGCFKTGAVIGAEVACGVASGATCSATVKCSADLACGTDNKCALSIRYAVTIDTKTEDDAVKVKAAVQTLLDAFDDGATPTPAKLCDGDKTTFTVEKSAVAQGWTVVHFTVLPSTCAAKLLPLAWTKLTADECTECTPYPYFPDQGSSGCKCAQPAEVFSQGRYILVEGKKQKDAEKFWKDAVSASAGKCIRALTFLPAGTGKFVMQYVAKNGAVDEACKKENDDGATKRADDFKLIATTDSSFKPTPSFQIPLVTECAPTDVIKCVADNAKCAGLVCGKTGACTAANQADVCASSVCDVKEGATDGKCNSASVVGYIVAVVAVIAAFVF